MHYTSIVRIESSFFGTIKALELIKDEVIRKCCKSKILIKPNFVSAYTPLCATPVETVKGVLEFLTRYVKPSEIIIAETPALGTLREALENYGYMSLKEEYPVEFIDLLDYDYEYVDVYDRNGRLFKVRVSKLLMGKEYCVISPCRAKTHDTVVVTLSIKNMSVGAIHRDDRPKIHQEYYYTNLNIAKIATLVMPDIGVVDGVIGMEGNGPVGGTPKKWGVVFASTNPVHLDAIVAYCMGFNPVDIGYLYFLNRWGYGEIEPSKIPIIGEKPDNVKIKFKPHSTYHAQLSWKKYIGNFNY